MDIQVKQGSIQEAQVDAIVLNLFEGIEVPAGGTGAVDKALGGSIAELIHMGDFKGKLNHAEIGRAHV